MNKQLNEKIKTIENKITSTKSALKVWSNQISQYYKALKGLTKQLETIKQQITMSNNNQLNNSRNNQGGAN